MDAEPWLQVLGRSCVSFPSGDNFVAFVDPVSSEVAGASATVRSSAEVSKLIDSAVRNHRDRIADAVQSREWYGWEERLESDGSLIGQWHRLRSGSCFGVDSASGSSRPTNAVRLPRPPDCVLSALTQSSTLGHTPGQRHTRPTWHASGPWSSKCSAATRSKLTK